MQQFVWTLFDEASGRVLYQFIAPEPADVIQPDPVEGGIWVSGDYDMGQHYLLDEVVTPRPSLGVPTQAAIPADALTEFAVADLPIGTHIEVLSAGGEVRRIGEGETADGTFAITFAEPGLYTIAFRPPFPWRGATVQISATEEA